VNGRAVFYEDLLMNSMTENARHQEAIESVVLSLALTIEARDSQTAGHCQRLATYAVALGTALNLDQQDLDTLRRGAFLHDIGKIAVPDRILLKPGPLTSAEYGQMKQHTMIGDILCSHLPSLGRVREIVRSHHERIDGSGYPDGLRNTDIPLLAQIMSIVDAFDALTTARPYKLPLSAEVAFRELRNDAVRGWKRGDLVETFIALVEDGQVELAEEVAWA
jgi:putative two-component system response regulator